MGDNGQVIWEDPPTPRHAPADIWIIRLQPLMRQPERWARVLDCTATVATSTVAQLRRRRRHIPPGRWEFISRVTQPGHAAIYARYLGTEEVGADG